mmetsp:Transcript_26637/g.29029  ORF Transcript_26637/g.29029 Transcript_26637/m.29029 type:complete len:275 (-) Transcript_26637:237-1061(-)|eukprot:CAMPEP_0173153582 /NCGR_PEP_ID=MMETSP1105-20130129/12947_1 /TAXON_ID=2985 /ORGANISM="Ochromonas sp., Strain BG-1" /LENGTH=274 /DNA_ID=CAMNT_0014069547 /DNA_START=72 /DNA_END=896 /DNA_ORIENTATION=+
MRAIILVFFVVMTIVFYINNVFAQEGGDLIPSLLLESAIRGDVDGISAALDAGEGIDVVNDKGWSAARFAVALGDLNFLRAVIEAGIDLNNPDNDGVTPLIAAAEVGDREAVELLLAGNASPLQVAADGTDAFKAAERSGRGVIQLLIAEASTLHAINADDLPNVLQSIRRGSYVNIRNGAGWTPLILASARNNVEAVKELLAAGADANRTENDGWTALHFAADAGNDKVVDALLAAGANGAVRNAQGQTARELALSHNFLTIVDKIPEPQGEF